MIDEKPKNLYNIGIQKRANRQQARQSHDVLVAKKTIFLAGSMVFFAVWILATSDAEPERRAARYGRLFDVLTKWQ